MSPENRKLAEHVAEDVKADIAAVVNGTNMSKKATRAKVAMAIKEIEGLQHKLEEVPNVTALNLEIATKNKELQAKKKELEMEEKEIKVMMLKKELVEKKLKLQKLMEAKMSSQQSKQSQKEEAKAQDEMVAKLAVAAKGMANVTSNKSKLAVKDNSTAVKNQVLSGVIADLKARSKKLSDVISKMDEDEKKRNANLEAMAKNKLPSKKDDPLAKGDAMLKRLEKEEHRKYQKERAIKKAQLAEIDSAIKSIAKGDLAALEQTLKKMKAEVKALDAKTGNFIY